MKPDRETLRRLYEDERYGQHQLASHFHAGLRTIKRWLAEYEIPIRGWGCGLGDDDHRAIVARYRGGETLQEIGADYGISAPKVVSILDAAGIERRVGRPKPCDLREDAFDVITEESAYWIGFLMADGCVVRPTHGGQTRIQLGLKADDIGHVERFREFLGSTRKISVVTNRRGYGGGCHRAASISVGSDRLAVALERFGMTPRKSLTARVIGLERNRDFWRGVVDGDGTIRVGPENRPELSLIGSHAMLCQFAEFIRDVCPGCRARPFARDKVSIFHVTDYSARKAIDAMYRDCAVALPRKESVARSIIACPLERKWGKWSHLTAADFDAMYAETNSWEAASRKLGISRERVKILAYQFRRLAATGSRQPARIR